MKIVISAYSAKVGGGRTYLINLLSNLPDDRDLEIHLFTQPSIPLPADPRIIRRSARWFVTNPLLRWLWEYFALPNYLKKIGADILFCPGGVVSTRIPRGCAVVTMFRNMIPFDARATARLGWGLQRLRVMLLRPVMLRSMRSADLTIFISDFARNVIERLIPIKQAVTIPHGIADAFHTTGRNLPRPASADDRAYVLYVSRLEPHKHHLEVVRGYATLPPALRADAQLLLAGEMNDDEARKVKDLVSELNLDQDIRFLGGIPYHQLPAFYRNARATIFASSCENCPNILLEALGAGRPVICSNVMPMPEFGGPGIGYFSPFDPIDFGAAITRVLTDADYADRLARAAKMRGEKYHWSVTAHATWSALYALRQRPIAEAVDRLRLQSIPSSRLLLQHAVRISRYARIYGPSRAMVKAMGRLRIGRLLRMGPSFAKRPRVAIIGCGQFAFSTIAYFLRAKTKLVGVYDPNAEAAASLGRIYGVEQLYSNAAEAIESSHIDLVYIASNHASHTVFAAAALRAGKTVYVEKPVAVSHDQLSFLSSAASRTKRKIFAGYNRPFSAAVRDIRAFLPIPKGPLTLSCFISGHVISADHWYRDPEEGTRICGNVGHWLDLLVHIVNWRHLPDRWRISLTWADDDARDDNLAISLSSDSGDLANIVLSARSEPFEGINETIHLQWGDVIAKIDDFRRMCAWKGPSIMRRRYWPKDVGHKRAILQPLTPGDHRPWQEIENSSLLMLRVMEMVRSGQTSFDFSFLEERELLEVDHGADRFETTSL